MYCGRRRSLRHSAVFICLTLAPAMFSGALFDIVVAPRPKLCRKPRLKTIPYFPVLGGSSLSTARRRRLVAAKLVSPAARSPRGLLLLLAAPLPENLAAQCFREPFLTSSSLRGLSFIEILALSLFLILFFFQVARSELPAGAADVVAHAAAEGRRNALLFEHPQKAVGVLFRHRLQGALLDPPSSRSAP